MDNIDGKLQDNSNDKIILRDIVEEMKTSYIDYSMSVITARALPDVRDGLKPVHRRILYAMNELNLDPSKAYKKSARIVGDTMGKYHPHGDSSIYDAMVRMAQDFSMRYMLVDGHGNFGSVDGDSPAAQRYTEARLSNIAMQMLTDISKDTVDFVSNYDGEFLEPAVLPSRFPNLLANGSSGIAVGMATNIPPHNICELLDAIFELIDAQENNTDIDDEILLNIVKGPDFPTGAFILGNDGIRNAYKTGRGKILMRANAVIESNNNRDEIIVSELPYQVNKSRLIEKIADLVKSKQIDGISDLRDESDRKGIRIVIEIKRDANARIVLNNLYKFSQLQETFGVIMLVLVNNEPRILSLKEALNCYIEHQKNIILRRTKYDLVKALVRQNILSGYLIALSNMDETLSIIRNATNISIAKTILCEKLNLNQDQATAVVEMKLKSLTSLESKKIQKESDEINCQVKELNKIIDDEKELFKVLKNELMLIKDKYGDKRRTRIVPGADENINTEDLIENKSNVITITKFDCVKRISLDSYKTQSRGGRGVTGLQMREEDIIKTMFIAHTHSTILYFTNQGRVYKNKAYEIPESANRASKGTVLINLLNLKSQEKIAAVIPVREYISSDYLIMVTKNGFIKKTEITQFKNINKNGLQALNFKDNDELVCVLKSDGNQRIFIATKNGIGITFVENIIRSTGRSAMGVHAIKLRSDDTVIGAGFICHDTKVLFVSKNGFGKCIKPENFVPQNRNGNGKIYYKVTANRGEVVKVAFVNPKDEVILINSKGVIIRIKISEISTQGRYAMGVKLINLDPGVTVIDIAKIANDLFEGGGENICEY